MIKIILKNKTYIWNWRRFLKNLVILAAIITFIITMGIVGNMDYKTAVGL